MSRLLLGVSASGWLVCCAAVPPSVGGQDSGSDSFDAGAFYDAGRSLAPLVDGLMNATFKDSASTANECPNAVAVVVTPQESLVRGYGAANAGSTSPPNGDSIFQIGSLTKVFTGLALAELQHRGRAQATDPTGAHLASDLSSALPTDVPTLAALASHTSGLPNYPDNLGGPDGGIDPLSPASGYSRASLRTFLQGWAPDSGAVLYSNLGFGLLGLAVTDTLNAGNYHDALETLITGPLEMSSTWGQISAIPSDALPRVVQGHTANRGWVNGRLADMGALAGGGEIASTGHDMARLMRAVVGLDTSPLESAITIALVPLARVSSGKDIGYGVGIEHRDGGDVFTKDGFTPSYSAFMIFSRQPAVGVAILTGCGKPFPVESVTRALFEQILATQN